MWYKHEAPIDPNIMATATVTIELKLKYILKHNKIILKNINISDILLNVLPLLDL